MVGAGIFGYFFKKYGFNASALVLGLVLGPMVEKHFRRGMQLNHNDIWQFMSSPIVIGILVVILGIIGYYTYKEIKGKKTKAEQAK